MLPPQIHHKHSLAIRWMHWINFPLLFTMIWSGLLIYWADSIPNQGHLSEVYRLGWGDHTLFRLFPQSFYRDARRTRPTANRPGLPFPLHVALPPQRTRLRFLPCSQRFVARPRSPTCQPGSSPAGHPPRSAFYAQTHPRRANTTTLSGSLTPRVVFMGAASCLTGVAIWKPSSLPWLTTLLGGYEAARWLHFWLTLAFVAFFIIHVVQVALAGWNNFRSMISGEEVVESTPVEQP